MGKKIDYIAPHIMEFIKKQHLFFVGTAASEGRVNVSPKGTDSFRVINKNKIIWLNLTGSGNETAAHLLQNTRMTIMFCAFEGKPLILRLYGNATIFHPRDEAFHTYSTHFPDAVGSRQIIEMDVDLVQTSCGFGVPFMDFKEERPTLNEWAIQKGEDGIKQYWTDKNTESIDGFETQILD
ncbi:pyridoxamine 5'-phosphate oxidase-like FMN-binding protein [Formosa agariphila KMM 3901]|uniref:Pyridoxamine 5'-phosphate oxidase-like FMN-binding protein n=1 Tax=Formosa agariphila (strain DSM 15362 / KCTC 12365 / LMG 23005 / KMM 3901 / M-2Alg 35-1) TaxID=1347342 RepID=T2KHA1_FORAG|nr:pyridoxamine 5'-phosphate oxidase family protein [Formosa agariphila]CDF78180.1 pyridoxamine 5'-phosphate oxidase-like FMN-binding protein [Formosa agariphila KMM 3901]